MEAGGRKPAKQQPGLSPHPLPQLPRSRPESAARGHCQSLSLPLPARLETGRLKIAPAAPRCWECCSRGLGNLLCSERASRAKQGISQRGSFGLHSPAWLSLQTVLGGSRHPCLPHSHLCLLPPALDPRAAGVPFQPRSSSSSSPPERVSKHPFKLKKTLWHGAHKGERRAWSLGVTLPWPSHWPCPATIPCAQQCRKAWELAGTTWEGTVWPGWAPPATIPEDKKPCLISALPCMTSRPCLNQPCASCTT